MHNLLTEEVFCMRKKILIILAVFLVLVVAGSVSLVFAKGEKKPEGPVTLRILYFQWAPGNAVAKTAAGYEAATGGEVKVLTELPGFNEWYSKWLASVQAQEYVWDIIVIDSQWLGMAVDADSAVELTPLIGDKPFVKQIPPTMKEYYMGDPTDSGKIWSVPLEADAELVAYRTDLFGDPKEKANFKKKYGYDLEVPKTWYHLRDIAEFFYRPDQNLYGYISKFGIPYDVITWDFDQVLWCFGGAFWDRATKTAEGYINSPQAVEAMEFYKSLSKYAPPGWPNAAFDETVQSMSQGLVAMAIEWSSFAPSISDPDNSIVYDKVAFAIPPAGPKAHFISLGGQPMTISAYSPYAEEAAAFIEWFYQPEQIWTYAENDGHPAYMDVLSSQRFWDILPQNKALYEALPYVRDVWNIPVYNELLQASQELLNSAVTGAKPIKAALDELAAKHQKILDDFYK
jgi:multiple sugar transport system substrate-binding protein